MSMRLCRLLWLLGGLGFCVSNAAFAQCPHASAEADIAMSNTTSPSTTSAREQPDVEDRTVLLTLVLSRSGAVRDARVLRGPIMLRAAAIKAVRERNYKHRILASSLSANEMMVEVKFPQNKSAPEIRQAQPAGVSGCVPIPTAVRIVLLPELNSLFNVQPIIPVLASEPTK
jgi:hypothetical protein